MSSLRERYLVGLMALLGILVRLYDITAGPWGKHGWRQADTAMIARNFYRHGFDLLHPQIDWAGPHPGYVGTEFPLVPYLTACFYAAAGPEMVWGRLVSLGFFLASILPFYFLIRRLSNAGVALWSLFFYSTSPLSIYYSQTLMPESAMLSLSLIALWSFSQWLDHGGSRHYALAAGCAVLACLIKMPAAILALPMGRMAYEKHGTRIFLDAKLWSMVLAVVVSCGLWYSHAWSVAQAHPPYEMFGESILNFASMLQAWGTWWFWWRLLLQTIALVLSPVGAVLALGGYWAWSKYSHSRIFHWWLGGILITVFLAFTAHSVHEYYQLPLVPLASAFAGAACVWLSRYGRAFQLFVVLAVLLPSLALAATRLVSSHDHILYQAGKRAGEILPSDALIVTWDGGSPVLLYAADRKGWNFPRAVRARRGQTRHASEEQYPDLLEDLRSRGAHYFVGPRHKPVEGSGWYAGFKKLLIGAEQDISFPLDSALGMLLENRYERIVDEPEVVIYDLRGPKTSSVNSVVSP